MDQLIELFTDPSALGMFSAIFHEAGPCFSGLTSSEYNCHYYCCCSFALFMGKALGVHVVNERSVSLSSCLI